MPLLLLASCDPEDDKPNATSIIEQYKDELNQGIATFEYLATIHDGASCTPLFIQLEGGPTDGKTVWVSVDPEQDFASPLVDVCISQLDPDHVKLKITNFSATDYLVKPTPNVEVYPGTIPTTRHSLRKLIASLNMHVHFDDFSLVSPKGAVHVTVPIADIAPQGDQATWSMELKQNAAIQMTASMTFLAATALQRLERHSPLVESLVEFPVTITDCLIGLINSAGQRKVLKDEAAGWVLDCLPNLPQLPLNGKAWQVINYMTGHRDEFIGAFELLPALQPHPDVTISLGTNDSIPPVEEIPADGALGQNGPGQVVPNPATQSPEPGGGTDPRNVAKGDISGSHAMSAVLTACTGVGDCKEPFTRYWSPTYVISDCRDNHCMVFDEQEWASPVALSFNGSIWRGSGSLRQDIAFGCNGVARTSPFSITFTVTSAQWVGDAWTATEIRGNLVESAAATAECTKAEFSWDLESK